MFPACYTRFLQDIESLPSIRKFVQQCKDDTELAEAYNNALLALKTFRDEHIKIVTLYVLSPSKRAAARSVPQPQPQTGNGKEELKVDEERQTGTGGTGDLFVFLKGMRDDTKSSIL